MPRPPSNNVSKSLTIDAAIASRVMDFANSKGLTFSNAVLLFIKEYFNKDVVETKSKKELVHELNESRIKQLAIQAELEERAKKQEADAAAEAQKELDAHKVAAAKAKKKEADDAFQKWWVGLEDVVKEKMITAAFEQAKLEELSGASASRRKQNLLEEWFKTGKWRKFI